MDRNEVLAGLKKAKGFFEARADMAVGEGKMLLLSWANAQAEAIELLKAQEPRVLQIKEMAFLEIAVFIETNGDLEGKGTDLFLAIPYIYAVSQNLLGGYIAFVDGNTDVYDLQAIDYGKLWRCWSARPTDEQREKVKWE